jgi:hypothetical protein
VCCERLGWALLVCAHNVSDGGLEVTLLIWFVQSDEILRLERSRYEFEVIWMFGERGTRWLACRKSWWSQTTLALIQSYDLPTRKD